MSDGTSIANQHAEVIRAIRDNITISDDVLEALLADECSDEDRKRLAIGLKCCGIINEDQAAFVFYQRPMGGV